MWSLCWIKLKYIACTAQGGQGEMLLDFRDMLKFCKTKSFDSEAHDVVGSKKVSLGRTLPDASE